MPPFAAGEDRIEVGIVLREQDFCAWSGRVTELARRSVEAGVDHLTVGDHISFADGHGADGLIQAAALLAADAGVRVQTGVARQLATIAMLAPGRLTFGVATSHAGLRQPWPRRSLRTWHSGAAASISSPRLRARATPWTP